MSELTLPSRAVAPDGPDARPARGERFGAATPGARPMLALGPDTDDPDERPSGRRRWLWPVVAAAVVLLAGGGYLVGRLTATGPGPQVVTLSTGVAAGSPVTAAELRLRHVTSPPPGALRSLTGVPGRTALRDVPAGSVLVGSDVGPATAYPKSGTVLVGISVKPGQAPAEALQPGDYVVAVEPPPSSGSQSQSRTPPRPVLLTGAVQVVAVEPISGGESVTVVVPAAQSVALGAQAAAGNVALLQTQHPAS